MQSRPILSVIKTISIRYALLVCAYCNIFLYLRPKKPEAVRYKTCILGFDNSARKCLFFPYCIKPFTIRKTEILEKGSLMKRIKWLAVVMLTAMAASATGVKIAGTLTTASGKPLAGAALSLINAGLRGTTDEDGMFGIYGDVKVVARANAPAAHAANPIVIGNAVLFNLSKATSHVRLDAFTAKGARIYSTELTNPVPGLCRLEIKPSGHGLGNGQVLIRLAIDDKITVLSANTLAVQSVKTSALFFSARLAKDMTAAIDTLKIQATGYKTTLIPIATYQLPTLTLSLDTGLTVSIDTSKNASKQDFLALVQRYRDLYYGECYGAEKTSVDSALLTLQSTGPLLSGRRGRTFCLRGSADGKRTRAPRNGSFCSGGRDNLTGFGRHRQ